MDIKAIKNFGNINNKGKEWLDISSKYNSISNFKVINHAFFLRI